MSGAYSWCYEDFARFYELLTLPDGKPARLEGHLRLICQEIFNRPGDSGLLVMLPKGNGKTALLGALAVYHMLVTPNANCFIGAANKEQAKEMYRFATHFVRAGSDYELERYAKVLGGTLEIRSRRDEGFILIIASDDSKQGGKKQGLNATLFLIDELHAHENDSLYTDGRSGLFKRDGTMVTITTAGWDQESTLGRLRAGFLAADQSGGTVERNLVVTDDGSYAPHPDGRLTVARIGDNAMLEWAAREDDDPQDFEAVKLANPASFVTVKSIRNAFEEPGITPWIYARYRMNRWTLGYESWLPYGAWDVLHEPGLILDPESPLFAAVDMARYRDCAALVAVQPRGDKPAAVKAWIWKPGGRDDPVPYATVMDQIRELKREFNLRACACDPRWFDQAAEELNNEGVPMEVTAQSNERMSAAAADLRQAILEGRLAHDGDPVLAAHVMAAVPKDVGASAFKLDKPRSSGPDIDAAEALSMAWTLVGHDEVSMYEDPEAIV